MRDLSEYFSKDYAFEWYSYGLDKRNDAIIKFTMHWIAFNWLYGDCDGYNEREKIKNFCKNHEQELLLFDAFEKPEIQVFMEKPVNDARGRYEKQTEKIYNDLIHNTGIEKVTDLLLTFYQVRCNLFHGQKVLRCDRDVELVEKSSVLLEGYLDSILNKRKKRFTL